MRPFPRRFLQVLAAMLVLGPAHVLGEPAREAGKLSMHVYGLSYHPDREGVRRNDMDNEENAGLGLNYTIREDAHSVRFVEAGFYRDSGNHLAKIAGFGYQFKFGRRWRVGGALVGVQSPTYNEGRFAMAPLPIVTYDFGPMKLNAIYAPRVGGYNEFAVFGIYFSLPLGR